MSAAQGNLASALVAALGELTTIDTNRTADAGSYSYDYADIADAVKLTRPVLAKNGLVALTPIHAHSDGLACTVILLHESGERIDLGPFPFPHGRDAQATGSMVTYHRRYALIAALGMAAGGDDDGASAAPKERGEPSVRGNRGGPTCVLCGESLAGSKAQRTPEGLAHAECAASASGAPASPDTGPDGAASKQPVPPVHTTGPVSSPTLEGVQ